MDDLRQHQYVMLDMLLEIDRICKKHSIKYSLFAGTLLGAVRHGGFIPWDDDVDVIMLRSEYERFMKIATKELNKEKYYLQKEYSAHWPMFFSKIRKNGTACIERYIPRDLETHLGVYVDIFPCDNLSDYKGMQLVQFLSSKIVIAKSLGERGYLTKSLLKKIFIKLCMILPRIPFIYLVKNENKDDSIMVHSFFGAASKFDKNIFKREWFTKTIDMTFEGHAFPVSAFYDEVLSKIYGEYMIPTPPEKQGCKVHGEIIDLANSYEKYKGIQKNMIFKELSKSIR